MNNDLEQFSEERLKKLISSAEGVTFPTFYELQANDVAALARIALSVKQAKPDYYIVRLDTVDAWGSDIDLTSFEDELSASKCKDDHGGVIIPCYTTPQPAHTEQDGWIKCSDRMPETYLNVLLTDEADDMCIGQLESHDDTDFFVVGCPRYKATHWMPLPASPKPESE